MRTVVSMCLSVFRFIWVLFAGGISIAFRTVLFVVLTLLASGFLLAAKNGLHLASSLFCCLIGRGVVLALLSHGCGVETETDESKKERRAGARARARAIVEIVFFCIA